MNIGYISDTHLEFRGATLPDLTEVPDVLIAAGDIGVGINGMSALLEKYGADVPDIIYVPGNHEFYSRNMPVVRKQLAEFAADTQDRVVGRIWLLDPGTVEINGVTFVGATAWTDYHLYNDPESAMRAAAAGMNDHAVIMNGYNTFTPADALAENKIARQFIVDTLERARPGAAVVVTHHAPCDMSLDPYYRMRLDSLNPCFASRWEGLMFSAPGGLPYKAPRFWVHGHVHHRVKYEIGETTVVTNPLGYPHEKMHRYVDYFQID